MPTFPLVLTDAFRRKLCQDVAGETFLELFDQALVYDHLLSVKLMETVHDPLAMVTVIEAVEAAGQATTAAFIAANNHEDAVRIADAQAMRSESMVALDHANDLVWLVAQFYLIHTWADVVEQWIEEAHEEVRRGPLRSVSPSSRPLLNVTPAVFREQARAFIDPLRQRLREQRPSDGVLTFDQTGTLATPVFECSTTDDLRLFLNHALAPLDARRRAGSIVDKRGLGRRSGMVRRGR